MDQATLEAEVVFLSPEDGGRQSLPSVRTRSPYSPHLVVQDRSVRSPRLKDKVVDEEYWAVRFVSGPESFAFGEPATFVLDLVYFPEIDYQPLKGGASFTVREGARIVGHGVVLERRAGIL